MAPFFVFFGVRLLIALRGAFFHHFFYILPFWVSISTPNWDPWASLFEVFLSLFEVFPGLDPIGPVLASPWAPGSSLDVFFDRLVVISVRFGYHFHNFFEAFWLVGGLVGGLVDWWVGGLIG